MLSVRVTRQNTTKGLRVKKYTQIYSWNTSNKTIRVADTRNQSGDRLFIENSDDARRAKKKITFLTRFRDCRLVYSHLCI